MNSAKENAANAEAFRRLVESRPVLSGMARAGEVIPGMKPNTVLHSGPEIEFAAMRGAHRQGIVGALLFEGIARDEKEAVGMIEAGEIDIRAANDFNSGAPGSGITSSSMAVLVVEEKTSGIRAFAPPIEGAQGGGLGGWGVCNPAIRENLRRIADTFAPLFSRVLSACGGIDVKALFAEGLTMGDEEHTRQVATDALFFARMAAASASAGLTAEERCTLLDYLGSCRRFVHHIGCATAVAALKSAANVQHATMVTAMGGNGVEFGIKLSGRGEQWFTAPSPTFTGRYFSPEYSDRDSSPWLGDSSNVEAFGLGGMAAGAAPILIRSRGGDVATGAAQTAEMAKICLGENPQFPIPMLDGRRVPCGIDARKVLETGILPMMHGGILSREGGQIGVGYAKTPLECFRRALN